METPNGQLIQQHQRPLTCSRFVTGVITILVLVCSAFWILVFTGPPTFFLLRLFSVHLSRRAIAIIFGHWLAMWPFFFEKVNKTKVIFAGHEVPAGERVMVICNHRTEVDWMYIWSLALRKGRIGYIKYVVKSSVRNAPIFGWAFHILEFLLIDRNWHVDEPAFESLLSTFKDRRDPLWLSIFPEGTDYTVEKCHTSQQYAKERGLPVLNHVLLPRTKGFYACLLHLHESLDAVYDLTIGYKTRCPLFIDNVFGINPTEVHIHIERIPISNIPLTEDEASAWLFKEYSRKDDLLSYFYKEGSFPDSRLEEELSMFKGMANVCIIVTLTYVFSRLMFSSLLWGKIYGALSCACLAAATYLNYKPSPIFLKQRARPLS